MKFQRCPRNSRRDSGLAPDPGLGRGSEGEKPIPKFPDPRSQSPAPAAPRCPAGSQGRARGTPGSGERPGCGNGTGIPGSSSRPASIQRLRPLPGKQRRQRAPSSLTRGVNWPWSLRSQPGAGSLGRHGATGSKDFPARSLCSRHGRCPGSFRDGSFQARSFQARPFQAAHSNPHHSTLPVPAQPRPAHPRPDHSKLGHSKPDHSRPDHFRLDPSQPRPFQPRPFQAGLFPAGSF